MLDLATGMIPTWYDIRITLITTNELFLIVTISVFFLIGHISQIWATNHAKK